jgi:hypothetical protein
MSFYIFPAYILVFTLDGVEFSCSFQGKYSWRKDIAILHFAGELH